MYNSTLFPLTQWQSSEFKLFQHMLATPLTNLQLFLQDSNTAHSIQTQTIQLSIVQLNASLQRIYDIFHFFTDPRKISRQQFNLIETVTVLVKQFSDQQIKLLIVGSQNSTIHCVGNKFLLEEAIICLIRNGLESYQTTKPGSVHITVWVSAFQTYISIRDFGTGIAWWQRLLLHVHPITTKRNGSGIGFSFATTVIERLYKGKIIIHSSSGVGTEIICILPQPTTIQKIRTEQR